MSASPMAETTIGEAVVNHLREQGWRVYQEVQHSGSRADIVATRGPLLQIVECKVRFGLDVLGQAWAWRRHAHFVCVATASFAARAAIGRRFLEDHGIGALRVHKDYEARLSVREDVQPTLVRRVDDASIRKRLTPELEAYGARAGNAGSDYYSPFKQTSTAVLRFVREEPGCTLRRLVDGIANEHHYMSKASARSSLLHWIEIGKIPGVRLIREGKAATVVLAEKETHVDS